MAEKDVMNTKNSFVDSIRESVLEFRRKYTLGRCREAYPDTTLTTITSGTKDTFTAEVALKLSQKVCSMTASGLLYYQVLGNTLLVYKSREFLKVARSFKNGVRVRYHDPEHSSLDYEAYISKDGINYKDGFAMVNLYDCVDPIDWGEVMAIYCRPVEEGGK